MISGCCFLFYFCFHRHQFHGYLIKSAQNVQRLNFHLRKHFWLKLCPQIDQSARLICQMVHWLSRKYRVHWVLRHILNSHDKPMFCQASGGIPFRMVECICHWWPAGPTPISRHSIRIHGRLVGGTQEYFHRCHHDHQHRSQCHGLLEFQSTEFVWWAVAIRSVPVRVCDRYPFAVCPTWNVVRLPRHTNQKKKTQNHNKFLSRI